MYRTDSVGGAGVSAAADRRLPLDVSPPIPERSIADRALKRGVDIAAALVFLVVGLPLYLAIGICVKLTSPGPMLYWQYRVGRGGQRFRFFKFRSMYVNGDERLSSLLATDQVAESRWQVYQKLQNDPRITTFGRFIRRTSLDELPQLWNVLKGDMSLVGPRPCMEQQERFYGEYWDTYCAMRPGLTGLWQVSGRNRLSYRQRVQLDVGYVQAWSMWLDLKIIIKTVKVVATGDGSH